MIDHWQLLEVAKDLARSKARGRPKAAFLIRSISSSYYALFHCLIDWAACDLIGQDRKSPRFRLVYRSYEHSDMRLACKAAARPLAPEFGIGSFCQEIQLCANSFVELQKLRHEADYDPNVQITLSDAQGAISTAETAMEKLRSAREKHRRLFLLTLRYKPRS
jgi:uncharacterized protein (UPF0332 family)